MLTYLTVGATDTDLDFVDDSGSVTVAMQGDTGGEMTTGRVAHEEQSVGAIQTRLLAERLRPANAVDDGVQVLRVVGWFHEDAEPRADCPLGTLTRNSYG